MAGARVASLLGSFLWTVTLLAVLTWAGITPQLPDLPLPSPSGTGMERPGSGMALQSDKHPVPAVLEKRPSLSGSVPIGDGGASIDLPLAPVATPGARARSAAAIGHLQVGLAVAVAWARAPPSAA